MSTPGFYKTMILFFTNKSNVYNQTRNNTCVIGLSTFSVAGARHHTRATGQRLGRLQSQQPSYLPCHTFIISSLDLSAAALTAWECWLSFCTLCTVRSPLCCCVQHW